MYCEVLTLDEVLEKVKQYLEMGYSVTVSYLNGVYNIAGLWKLIHISMIMYDEIKNAK